MASTNTIISENSSRVNREINLENLFSSPGIIVRDIYELFNSKTYK